MPTDSTQSIPEDVQGEIESLIVGEGPMSDTDEAQYLRQEDADKPVLDDPQTQDDAELSLALLQTRIQTLEEASLTNQVYEEPILLPDDVVEFGIPATDIVADSDVVQLIVTSISGEPIGDKDADPDQIAIYACDDRSIQALGGRGWIATDGETIGTILSFVRFP
ncbi:unnamed protein product, partial [marine sediment metagenome]